MDENALSKIIVDAVFHVHRHLGPGLFESVYEEVLAYEFQKRNLQFNRQRVISIEYKDCILIPNAFKADFIVEKKIIIELKAIENLAPIHHKQLLTYLRLTEMKLGLLVNFNEVLIKDGIHRLVNNL